MNPYKKRKMSHREKLEKSIGYAKKAKSLSSRIDEVENFDINLKNKINNDQQYEELVNESAAYSGNRSYLIRGRNQYSMDDEDILNDPSYQGKKVTMEELISNGKKPYQNYDKSQKKQGEDLDFNKFEDEDIDSDMSESQNEKKKSVMKKKGKLTKNEEKNKSKKYKAKSKSEAIESDDGNMNEEIPSDLGDFVEIVDDEEDLVNDELLRPISKAQKKTKKKLDTVQNTESKASESGSSNKKLLSEINNVEKVLKELDEEDAKIVDNQIEHDKELKNAKACQNQQTVYEKAIDARLSLHPLLQLANRFPQLDTYYNHIFAMDFEKTSSSNKNVISKLENLKIDIIDTMELMNEILENFAIKTSSSTKNMTGQEDLKDGKSLAGQIMSNKMNFLQRILQYLNQTNKSSREDFFENFDFNLDKLWDELDQTFLTLIPEAETTIDKWSGKLNILNTNALKGKFISMYQTPIQQATKAMDDFDRLIKRTQLIEFEHEVIGRIDDKNIDNINKSEYDPEIFNDQENYLALFREALQRENKSDSLGDGKMTQEGLLIGETQNFLKNKLLKSKVVKNVDRRASKNRKIRYDSHTKLINFMTPTDNIYLLPGRENIMKNLFGLYDKVNEVDLADNKANLSNEKLNFSSNNNIKDIKKEKTIKKKTSKSNAIDKNIINQKDYEMDVNLIQTQYIMFYIC